ncbi:hypothetical protein [Rhodopirellula baltica]|uniref:hypothetical protein n=1 Tax=Rhodopirellula baltica TaxID=265606 RepID=UPI0007C84A0E|nr:hypothetical protein [Rhodopirellula baltica]
MPDDSPYNPPSEIAPTVRPRRLRRWFLGGFAIVFAAMLILMNQYFYAGDALVQCKLWQFYLMEIRRAFTSSGALGPTTGSGGHAFVLFLQHVAIAGVGGLISLGIGAFVTRPRA